MKLLEILNRLNEGYPDGYLAGYYNANTGRPVSGSGDTLAQFIVIEVSETYDETISEDDQWSEVARVLERAKSDLQGVLDMIPSHIMGA